MPGKELQRKWRLAKQKLASEFDIPSERLHLIFTIRELFVKYVTEHELSDNAAIALYYRLSFFSILLTVRTSAEADDCIILEKCIASINDAIESLVQEYH